MYGELVPLGGGDRIPLLKKKLRVGRREDCDVVLRFDNVSAYHCELTVIDGYWYVLDLNSRNGIKINGVRVTGGERRIDPGDTLHIARHRYRFNYVPAELGAVGPPPDDEAPKIFQKSLLERAGLVGKRSQQKLESDDPDLRRRRDPDTPVRDSMQRKNRPV